MKHASTQAPNKLVQVGPLVEVTLLAHPRIRGSFTSGPPVTATFLLDTGAQSTFVERRLAEQMRLAPIRYIPVVGVSEQRDLCPVYLMTIRMAVTDYRGNSTDHDFSATVVGITSPPGLHGLLGRDFMRSLRIIYDGPRGLVELHVASQGPSQLP